MSVLPSSLTATTEPPTRAAPRDRTGFALFWSGETVSMFGSQVTLLALPLTAVLALHATAAQLGLLRFLAAAPYVLCTLIFGAWVDRRRRRPVLILANVARAVIVGAVPLLAILRLLSLTTLAIAAFVAGVFTVLFEVTWLAYVPSLVAPERLVTANGRLATSAAAAEVGGPGLAGVLIQWLSAPLALLADAASYVVATITLLLIRVPEPAPAAREAPHLSREIGEGMRTVWRDPIQRAIALMSGLWNCCNGVAETTFLLYAIRERGLDAGALGGVLATGAVGGLLGATISTRVARRGRFGPLLAVAFTFGCLPWVLLPAVTSPLWLAAGAYALAFFLVHVGLGLWSVLVLSLRQSLTPAHLLGRTSASIRLISYGLGALGVLLAGVLGSLIGLRPALWLAAGGFLAILAVTILATPLPRVRSLSLPPSSAAAVVE